MKSVVDLLIIDSALCTLIKFAELIIRNGGMFLIFYIHTHA
jgi:hypothetical protein